jgi:phosphopantetheinyl transferase (holo-ACP synthase)
MSGAIPFSVGNDVVDLCDPSTVGKSLNERFVARILSPQEVAVFGERLTDTLLWQLWAAKESAYKIVAKVFGTSPPARALSVRAGGTTDGELGFVDTAQGPIQVRWTVEPQFVHCVAWWPHTAPADAQCRIVSGVQSAQEAGVVKTRLSRHERLSARNTDSGAVRSLAKALFARDDEAVGELEIIRDCTDSGFGPPHFQRHGRLLPGTDLSLSHHGRFVAAVVTRPPSGSGMSEQDANHG